MGWPMSSLPATPNALMSARRSTARPSAQSIALAGYAEYDVSRDGRFLVNVPVASPTPTALVTLNWKAGLKKWMNGSL
jgi:hypothetical protein